jgi:hypothetical protein
MKRKALIRDGKVAEMIIAADDYKHPAGHRLVETLDANIGDLFDGSRFSKSRPKLKREDLLLIATAKRQTSSLLGFDFELENGEKVNVPTDSKTRQDILEIASLGVDSAFVFPDGPRELTAKDLAGIARKIAKRTASLHATLAQVVEAINREQIVFEDQIDAPEKLSLKKWID